MQQDDKKKEEGKLPAAPTGNASNPSRPDDREPPTQQSQLLHEKAETYLRESGNIEDMPDETDDEGRS